MKKLIKKKYWNESCVYKVSAFIGPNGDIVSNFKECTVVMVSPLKPKSGPTFPRSKAMFMPDTEMGDLFREEISRFPLP
jgi:hypothetical protein